MKYSPPVKGKFLKKPIKPVVTGSDLVDSIDTISQAVAQMNQVESDFIDTANAKIEEVDSRIQEGIDTLSAQGEELRQEADTLIANTTEAIESAKEEALNYVKEVKVGDPGKNADEEMMLARLQAKIPAAIDVKELEKSILAKIPKFDEKSMTARILKAIPENKASLKIIQKSFEVDPMSVIEKIMALPGDKFKLKSSQIDGLEQTISAFRNQLGHGYLHGGGISDITGLIQAGTNVTITGNGTKTSPYVINATGGGGGSVQSVTGLNTDNTDPANPIVQISVDGVTITGLGTPGSPLMATQQIELETNGTPNGSQSLLNLVQGTNMTISDDGLGNITFNASGSGGVDFGTDGQIPFMNPTDDNFDYTNDLFWNASNSLLGIGTNTPIARLQVNSPTTTLEGIRVQTTDDNTTKGSIVIANSTGNPVFTMLANGNLQNNVNGTFSFLDFAGNVFLSKTNGGLVSLVPGIVGGSVGVTPILGGGYNVFNLMPQINYSGSSSYTILNVDATENSTPSGTRILADFKLNSTSVLKIEATGNITAANLAGTGTRMVVASNVGLLSTQAIPAGTVTSVSGTTNRITVATGTTTPVIDIAATYVGQTSITTLGTITTGVWNGTAIANANLANSSITIGSTNISLGATSTTLAGLTSVTSTTFVGALTGNASTATNVAVGGITGLGAGVATALAVNVGTAGAFVVNGGALGTPSSGTVTNLTGTASININGTANGVTLTTGGSASQFLNGTGSYTTPSSGGLTWSAVTVNATFTVNTGTLANKGTLLTMTLPTTSAVGDVIAIAGMNAGLWKVAQNASQQIHFGNQNTTSGTGGSLASVLTYDSLYMVCSVANLEWVVINSAGNITVT